MVTAEQRALASPAHEAQAAVTVDLVWDILAAIPDPEVPVVSIVELGIVRAVSFANHHVRIEITPTYSGCPATEMIAAMIRERMAAVGIQDVELLTVLAPAWTTDWIAPEARRKLTEFGIAPPHVVGGRVDVTGISPLRRAKVVVPCPQCGSTNTTLLSQFGSTACKAQYRCEACREPFDYFKSH